MNRYMIPATLYVDADSLLHAIDIFDEISGEQGVVEEGIEIDRSVGMVVYLNEKVVKDAQRQRFVMTEENDLNADYIAD